MNKKAIVAFSGGLDTSVVVKYLQYKYGFDVITTTIDVGQNEDYKMIEKKAKKLGVKKHYTIDVKKEFVERFIFPAIKANSLYQKKYCLATALTRPLIAEKIIDIAKNENADAIAHGCSGKGNDQVRLDTTIHSNSELPIIAPIRDLNLNRETELEFAREHNIEINKIAKKFSVDQNLWGRSIEGGVLEDPFNEPSNEIFIWVKTSSLPDKADYADIKFEKGIPVSIDNKIYNSSIELINDMNIRAGNAGIGIVDHIEDRVIGMKSREVYETPGAMCLIEAHNDLEKLVHTKHEIKFKSLVDDEWSWMIYSGLWQDPLRKDLDMFINNTQKCVTGIVKIKMYKGNMRVVGRKSTNSLYKKSISTYNNGSEFDQKLSNGFIKLWGMQSTEANKLQKNM